MRGSQAGLDRRGFVLLAVLWVIVGLTVLALAATLSARNAIAAARNRTELTRARWLASECAELVRASIADVLLSPSTTDVRGLSGWSALDRVVLESRLLHGAHCDIRMRAVGARIDINHADAEMLGALLARLGMDAPKRDSMVDALLDWRDADDIARPLGAEREWYASHARFAPRNGDFADVREIARVRGFESMRGLDSVFDVELGRISLVHAPLAVIAALPGMSEELLARIAEQRARGVQSADMTQLTSLLSPGARQMILARYSDLVHSATIEPDAWVMQARATAGSPAVTVVVELRLVRAGDRAAVVRERVWIA